MLLGILYCPTPELLRKRNESQGFGKEDMPQLQDYPA
jgi:hypothetical protein